MQVNIGQQRRNAGACAKVESDNQWTDKLLPQILAGRHAPGVEWPQPPLGQIGQMGIVLVQVRVSSLAQATSTRKLPAYLNIGNWYNHE